MSNVRSHGRHWGVGLAGRDHRRSLGLGCYALSYALALRAGLSRDRFSLGVSRGLVGLEPRYGFLALRHRCRLKRSAGCTRLVVASPAGRPTRHTGVTHGWPDI